MSDLFKAISSSFSRFVYAWMLPSALTVGVFIIFLQRLVRKASPIEPILAAAHQNRLSAGVVIAFAVITLSVLFAYTSRPIYEFLEGYTLPMCLQRRLRNRRLREWQQLKRISDAGLHVNAKWRRRLRRLALYPEAAEHVLPTRLGNALKSLELYGVTRFGLDSQTLWYELQAVTPPHLRRDIEDTRSAVDFFVSSIAHLVLLLLVSAVISIRYQSPTAAIIAVGAFLLLPVAYRGAVRNVGEWRWAVQALVNTGRPGLASALGLIMPETFHDELDMWSSFTNYVQGGDQGYLEFLNVFRRPVEGKGDLLKQEQPVR